jgi:hypothetical protein
MTATARHADTDSSDQPQGTAGLDEIPFDEILADLGDSAVARMLLQAIDASRDATDWLEHATAQHTRLAADHRARHARILADGAANGRREWELKARADVDLADPRAQVDTASDQRQLALEAVRSRREELTAWAALAALATLPRRRPARPRAGARRTPPTSKGQGS